MIGATGVQMFGTVIELGLPAGVGIFLQSFDLGDFRLVLGHGFVCNGLLQSIDECRIPLPYSIDRIIEAGAAGTDHGTANASDNARTRFAKLEKAPKSSLNARSMCLSMTSVAS